jgi:hypothetical protein
MVLRKKMVFERNLTAELDATINPDYFIYRTGRQIEMVVSKSGNDVTVT